MGLAPIESFDELERLARPSRKLHRARRLAVRRRHRGGRIMTAPASRRFRSTQYQALRGGCGSVELADWSSVTVTGADRQTFLNNFCTNDVKRLAAGRKLRGVLHERQRQDSRPRPGRIAATRNWCSSRFPGRRRSSSSTWIATSSAKTCSSATRRPNALTCSLPAARGPGRGLTHDAWIRWHLLNVPVCGLLEATPGEFAASSAGTAGRRSSQRAASRRSTRCASNRARRSSASTSTRRILPQEVGRDEQAISFTKGCYLGQETVARIDALGHVNQQIVGVRFAGTDIPAAKHRAHPGRRSGRARHVGRIFSATRRTAGVRHGPPAMARAGHASWNRPPGACEVVALPLKSLSRRSSRVRRLGDGHRIDDRPSQRSTRPSTSASAGTWPIVASASSFGNCAAVARSRSTHRGEKFGLLRRPSSGRRTQLHFIRPAACARAKRAGPAPP